MGTSPLSPAEGSVDQMVDNLRESLYEKDLDQQATKDESTSTTSSTATELFADKAPALKAGLRADKLNELTPEKAKQIGLAPIKFIQRGRKEGRIVECECLAAAVTFPPTDQDEEPITRLYPIEDGTLDNFFSVGPDDAIHAPFMTMRIERSGKIIFIDEQIEYDGKGEKAFRYEYEATDGNGPETLDVIAYTDMASMLADINPSQNRSIATIETGPLDNPN